MHVYFDKLRRSGAANSIPRRETQHVKYNAVVIQKDLRARIEKRAINAKRRTKIRARKRIAVEQKRSSRNARGQRPEDSFQSPEDQRPDTRDQRSDARVQRPEQSIMRKKPTATAQIAIRPRQPNMQCCVFVLCAMLLFCWSKFNSTAAPKIKLNSSDTIGIRFGLNLS